MNAREFLTKHNACKEAIEWVGDKTIAQAWNECECSDWMFWIYMKTCPENSRELSLAKGHCANTVRHLMKDPRSIAAVDAAIAFGEGIIDKNQLNAAAYATYVAYVAAAAAAAATAAAAASYAYVAAAEASYAAYAAAAAAVKQNPKQTADICRKYLHPEFLK